MCSHLKSFARWTPLYLGFIVNFWSLQWTYFSKIPWDLFMENCFHKLCILYLLDKPTSRISMTTAFILHPHEACGKIWNKGLFIVGCFLKLISIIIHTICSIIFPSHFWSIYYFISSLVKTKFFLFFYYLNMLMLIMQ